MTTGVRSGIIIYFIPDPCLHCIVQMEQLQAWLHTPLENQTEQLQHVSAVKDIHLNISTGRTFGCLQQAASPELHAIHQCSLTSAIGRRCNLTYTLQRNTFIKGEVHYKMSIMIPRLYLTSLQAATASGFLPPLKGKRAGVLSSSTLKD